MVSEIVCETKWVWYSDAMRSKPQAQHCQSTSEDKFPCWSARIDWCHIHHEMGLRSQIYQKRCTMKAVCTSSEHPVEEKHLRLDVLSLRNIVKFLVVVDVEVKLGWKMDLYWRKAMLVLADRFGIKWLATHIVVAPHLVRLKHCKPTGERVQCENQWLSIFTYWNGTADSIADHGLVG